MDTVPRDPRYNKVLTLRDLVFLGLSMTIGSGIFVLINDATKVSHNLVWVAMLLAGIMSLLTALGYGELAGIFPNNMGEADYVRSVTNETVSRVTGFALIISDIFILSTIALGLGNYIQKVSGFNTQMVAILAIVFLNYLNYRGIRLSTDVSHMALYIKVAIILVIILISFIAYQPKENFFDTSKTSSYGLTTASIILLFAYLGFNNITNFTEETFNAEVNIGKSIIYTVALVTIFYTILVISSMYVLTAKQLSQTNTPLATVTGKLFGSYGFMVLVILAIISLSDTLLVTCVSVSRYIHSFLSHVFPQYGQIDMSEQHKTPYLSIILLVILAIVVIYVFQQIATTAIYGDLLIMTIFIIVNLVVIILRYKRPEEPRKFKVPCNIGKLPIPSVMAIIIGVYAIYRYAKHAFD